MVMILIFSFFYFLFIPNAFSLEPQLQVIEGTIREGDTFSQSLSEKKISLNWINLIISKLKPMIDLGKIRGGSYRISRDEDGRLARFVYEAGPTEIYEIERTPGGEYLARRKEPSLTSHLVKVEGEIQSSGTETGDRIRWVNRPVNRTSPGLPHFKERHVHQPSEGSVSGRSAYRPRGCRGLL
jgi:hypothetical protein